MKTPLSPAVGIYSAKAVSQWVGLDSTALRKLGVPAGDQLTRDDLAALLAELKRRGYPTRAHSLEVHMRQQRETPSRALLEPMALRPKYPFTHPEKAARLNPGR